MWFPNHPNHACDFGVSKTWAWIMKTVIGQDRFGRNRSFLGNVSQGVHLFKVPVETWWEVSWLGG